MHILDQLAEISAAKRKVAPEKSQRARTSQRPDFMQISQKMAEKGPNFL
jgi:hypothetical protein